MSEERPPRRLRWGLPENTKPKHAYRDTMLVYAGLCIALVLFAWLSGGSVVKGVIVAVVVFVVATTYSLVLWHDLARHVRSRGRRP